MTRRLLPNMMACLLFVLPLQLHANDLVAETRKAQQQETASNTERETRFTETENALQRKLNALLAQRETLNAETEKLSLTLSENEQNLAQLEEKRRLETGSLGDVFDVIRSAASELEQTRKDSPASALQPNMDQALSRLNDARELPSLSTLKQLSDGLLGMLENSAQVEDLTVTVRDGNGEIYSDTVTRLGDITLVDGNGFLEWDSAQQQANQLPTVSGKTLTQDTVKGLSMGSVVTFDPTRGELVKIAANAPSLSKRVAQGGVVGGMIIVLMVVGLMISVVRAIALFSIGRKMAAQEKAPDQPSNNPLGRVLSIYSSEPDRSFETLELRLLEAVMDEQEQFEKGLSMLKLLAALAPMLGLLGTVTGMIETFQVITNYGNGNPSIMAGGISTALVTTVMGLIAAIPLLLAHNVLASKADALRGMLEKKGVSLIAQQAEMAASAQPLKAKL